MEKSNQLLEPELRELVSSLRAEANGLKDCFTRYAFAGMTFSSAVIGIVVVNVWDKPLVGLAGIAAIIVVLNVSRLGTFKYQAANRHYGYELHLSRTKSVPLELRGSRWQPHMRFVAWEEVMRAWRVVQATLFDRIYVTVKGCPNYLHKQFRQPKRQLWFSQESLLQTEGSKAYFPPRYHAGSYLQTVMTVLHALAAGSVVLMAIGAYGELGVAPNSVLRFWYLGITLITALCCLVRMRWDNVRREIVEDGLLSIHSCAIVWQAVVIAHHSAIADSRAAMQGEAPRPDGAGMLGYTRNLGRQAASLAMHADDIHGWIAGNHSDAPMFEDEADRLSQGVRDELA